MIPVVWAIHDGKVGMANQVLGLAEAIGWGFVEKRLAIRSPWRHLAPPLWVRPLMAAGADGDRLAPPWPELVIATGRNAVAPALAVKRSSSRTFWVQIQDPRFARRAADLLLVPSHDAVTGPNVVATLGAIHRVTGGRLAAGAARFAPLLAPLPRPLVAVLLGGDNRVFRLSAARLRTLAEQLKALAAQGFGLAITPSRRTGDAVRAALGERLKGSRTYLWDGTGDNPYYGLLAVADVILVTADSVNMVSEAAATGKPVHVLPLDGGSAKFKRFHRIMQEAGITRPFTGAIEIWTYHPPEEAARAAAIVRDRVSRRLAEVA
ncbi:MAG: mitochondrial fission ELM1 family protein [Stellaceae bacterium]